MATTAVPTAQPSSSSPESGVTPSLPIEIPRESGESGAISWKRVLPQTRESKDQLAEFLRRRREKTEEGPEVRVSAEAVAIAKASLVRSLFLHSEGGDSHENAFFAQVAGVLLNKGFLNAEGIDENNIPQDFEGKRKFFEDLVERFYKRFPHQAIALGVYSAAWEWQMVMSGYEVSFEPEEGQELVIPDPAFIISAKRSVTVNPDGTYQIIYEPSREETYEEYVQRITKENNERGFLRRIFRPIKPLSKEEFEQQKRSRRKV